ncbi:MAG TPA: peptide deformylase, partial [Candidatus Deferrimicrobiaceae bacterium]
MRRNILVYPDPFLARKAVPVATVDDRVRTLIRDMFETMYAAEGIGLAAPQVGVGKRVIVLDVSPVDENVPPMAVVNPEIVSREGSTVAVEGCLSVPGVQGEVCRAESIEVRGLDE